MQTIDELAADIDEIVRGCHSNPFRVLGPHPEGDGWVVRTFQSSAAGVDVILDGVATTMQRVREEGLFTVALDGQPRRYRLRVRPHDGASYEIEDPYRFWTALEDRDLLRFGSGIHYRSHDILGAHLIELDGVRGVRFSVWAPNALSVCVVGDFNGWDTRRHPMRQRDSGVWEIFIPGAGEGDKYKYMIRSRAQLSEQFKTDPFGFAFEEPPRSASIVVDLGRHRWSDTVWMTERAERNWLQEPVSIYEVHLESWLRGPHGEPLTYREMASTLVDYVTRLGCTHIELLPTLEHPFGGSWGYQVTGYFAPTARFGPPGDFMYFVDHCHQAGIGVILDWVPAHFPKDEHALARFDGTALYEHEDPRQGEHRDWGTLVFNFGRNEVRSFLLSSAIFWLEKYHLDGLRVDAVASMLYLDYSRQPGEWLPNRYGGRENLDAIEFLQRFNEEVHKVSGAITIAEESTSFTGVSRPVYVGGLGFTMKWNMGWMHDMLEYFSMDSIYRRFHHQNITFSMLYAFSENFVLPISHDEVVHLKKSLIGKMPGDEWQRFANVRAFLAYMYTHPGKKLLFMGSEIGQYEEWSHEGQVRWELLEFDYHRKLQQFVAELNRVYRAEPALHEVDFDWQGFEWVDLHDSDASTISFLRRAADPSDFLLVCCNFTPMPRTGYRLGVPQPGLYREILNSDSEAFAGSNMGNKGGVVADKVPSHGRPCSVVLTMPPLAVVVFKGPQAGDTATAA